MKSNKLKITALALVLSTSGLANAGLINGGFENDLAGWTFNSSSSTSVVSNHENLLPTEGDYFLKLIGDTSGGANNVNNTVSQTFNLNSGGTIQGFASFDWNDYSPFYDYAAVEIYNSNDILLNVLWTETGFGLPNYANTPWSEWSFTADNSGEYTIVFSSSNTEDSINSSIALFDGASITSVPEPSTLAIFALGIMGLASRRFAKK